MTLDLSRVRPHDLGGQNAGAIDRGEHELAPWHRLVTAIATALRAEPHRFFTVDEMRRVMEDMPPEDYRRLEYFERWAVGVSALVVEKGLLTRAEIEARLSALGGAR